MTKLLINNFFIKVSSGKALFSLDKVLLFGIGCNIFPNNFFSFLEGNSILLVVTF